jgi:hypothetical protein
MGKSPMITRRSVMGSAALALVAAAPAPTAFPDGATLLVAGPNGGPVDSWAEWLAPGLGRTLSPGVAVRKDIVGGLDGVTGANQFEARTVPDGGTALLLPGSAAMAWLVGDPRARFDAARWVPTLAAVTPGLVLSRLPARQALGGTRLRFAATGPADAELPAMLALDLLGADWTPVYSLPEAAAMDALARGEVDAICLRGRHVADTARLAMANGATPLFSFGSVDGAGVRQRDPAFPDVMVATELLARHPGNATLGRAWFATAAASELDVAMVLPQLTPAAMVALWRRAVTTALGSDALQAQASAVGVRPMPSPAASASTGALLADAATQLELRRWLATRLNYRAA